MDTRTIELWLDALNAVWALSYRNKMIRTPRCVGKDEYPEGVTPADISSNGPIALSWPESVQPEYGAPGSSMPVHLTWYGVTHLHLTPDSKAGNLAFILPMFGKALQAARADCTLGGLVANFYISREQNGMALMRFQSTDESWHQGLEIRWIVIEKDMTGKFSS